MSCTIAASFRWPRFSDLCRACPSGFSHSPRRRLVDRDGGEDDEEHGRAGHLEGEVEEFLDGNGEEARDRAAAVPVSTSVRAKPAVPERERLRRSAGPMMSAAKGVSKATLRPETTGRREASRSPGRAP